MQINTHGVVAALMMTTLVVSPLAEAKRVGGGKSYGMSRSSSSSYNQNYSQNRQAPVQQGTVQPQRSGPGVGSMVAAGVAGAAVGAVAANAMADDPATSADAAAQQQNAQALQTEQKSSFNWLWIALLAIGAFFLFRRLSAKKAAGPNSPNGNPFAPNNAGPFGRSSAAPAPASRPFSTGADNTNIFGQSVGAGVGAAGIGAAYNSSGQQLPDGTEPAAFLRQARAKFLHLQSMNSSSNIEEVRRYFSPDMYAAVRNEIMVNDELAEFPQLNAQVVESGTDNGQHFASVQFSGTVSEAVHAQAVPFSETWHFVKPVNSSEWLVAGIQQNQ